MALAIVSKYRKLTKPTKHEIIFTSIFLIIAVEARISVIYAHDRISDKIAVQCLSEMYPKVKNVDFQESDEACIIFCILKKFGIMNTVGAINMEHFRRHVLMSHQLNNKIPASDFGNNCAESAEATVHKQDVCKKAKVFNDCTHLYRILL